MEDELWVLTLRAKPSAVPVRSRINQVLKYAARRDLACVRLDTPDLVKHLQQEIAVLQRKLEAEEARQKGGSIA